MIDFYFWPTPNGHKVSIMLEECGLDYQLRPINILTGEQRTEAFLKINPNRRIPAIVDHDGPGGDAITLIESGAILMYLADKSGQFWPQPPRERYEVTQWLMFQMANVGPMFGQCGHFRGYAPEQITYAIDRYFNETLRLYGVLNQRLASQPFLAGAYSIADMATFPWMAPLVRDLHQIDIGDFPHVARWYEEVGSRPSVVAGMSLLEGEMKIGNPTDQTREAFFATD